MSRVAVIGAGIVGATIAYHASRAGCEVTVFDGAFTLRGTSGSTQAWVWIQSKRPDHYAELSYLSRELYPGLEDAIGSVEFSATGGLTPVFSAEGESQAKTLIGEQNALGLRLQWLSPEEVQKYEPHLNPEVRGAIYSRTMGTSIRWCWFRPCYVGRWRMEPHCTFQARW